MQFHRAARAATIAGAFALLVAAAGCGGGGSDTAAEPGSEATSSEEVPLAQAQAYTVSTQELMSNVQFASGSTSWTLSDAALVASELRAGGQALNVGWMATQALASTAIIPGRSYTLIVKARADRSGGTSQISMRFRKPKYAESIRTYPVAVSATGYQDYRIDFTAPNYTAMADIVILASGARLIVDTVSLKMRSAIVQTEPITFSTGSYVPAGYTLAFNDEFTGGSLKRSKWFTRYIYGGESQDHLNDEKQR